MRIKNENQLKIQDKILINNLNNKVVKAQTHSFRNKTLQARFSKLGIKDLFDFLKKKGTFDVSIEGRVFKDIDGEKKKILITRATKSDMWPMGTNYWLRDNAIIANRFLNSKNKKDANNGKKLLLSALTIISSVTQLERFKNIIKSKSKNFKNNPNNWPHIFLSIKDNLNSARDEPWSHKQDAWQIIAYYTLEALEKEQILIKDLNKKHKEFLKLIIPFLKAIDFTNQENSGSWEEIPAIRTSVIAWETALINKILELSKKKDLKFLLNNKSKKLALKLLDQGMEYLEKSIPFEAPSYRKKDVRYRKADSALIYLLQLDIPKLLANYFDKDLQWELKIENKIFKQITSLKDPVTGCYKRYKQDSYLRDGFFRNVTVQKLIKLCGAPSGDASKDLKARLKILARGREAVWCHFVWQIASWSYNKYLETGKSNYKKIAKSHLKIGLKSITAEKEFSLEVDKDGKSQIIKIPSYKITEAFISERVTNKETIIFPCPHTPLNWASAEAHYALKRMIVKI